MGGTDVSATDHDWHDRRFFRMAEGGQSESFRCVDRGERKLEAPQRLEYS